MRNVFVGLFLIAAIATGGWTVYRQVRTPPTSVVIGEEPEDITYICTETGDVSHGEWQVMPALNPKTGRKTLVQALYCSKCRNWYPAPPPEMVRQSPRGPTCPKDGSTLSVEEPFE